MLTGIEKGALLALYFADQAVVVTNPGGLSSTLATGFTYVAPPPAPVLTAVAPATGAKLDAVIWRGSFGRLRAKMQEGLEVIATGKITSYPMKSGYQIVIESIEPAGVGALMALLEERKKKLTAEGLFDAARKRAQAEAKRVGCAS